MLQRKGELLYGFSQCVYAFVLLFIVLTNVLDIRLTLLHITSQCNYLLAEFNHLFQHRLSCCLQCLELNSKTCQKRIGVIGNDPGLGLETFDLYLLLPDVGADLLEFCYSLGQHILRFGFRVGRGR
jgi:hypothetical protein